MLNRKRKTETILAIPNQIIDCKVLESKGIDSIRSTIYFMGVELTGGSKSTKPYNECFFGTLDSKDSHTGLDTLKPIYHLISETDYDTKDSKESFTQTLQVFLNNSTLTILNYSLLDSSLNIKLECNSSESKEIIKQEIDCHEAKASRNGNKESISTAFLCPILEDNELKCPHNGISAIICYNIKLAS